MNNSTVFEWASDPGPRGEPGVKPRARLTAFLLIGTLVLYGSGFTRSVGEFLDASHHLMNGIFIHDVLNQLGTVIKDPMGFAYDYYRHYPAVNLGYYLPGFPLLEAVFMLLFGVSGSSGQLTVLLMAGVMTVFTFRWFQLRLEPYWAAGATLWMVTTPLLVYWGRDIMLEVPLLAWSVGAVWSFETMLRAERVTWCLSMRWALLAALAMSTKQHALMLVPIFGVCSIPWFWANPRFRARQVPLWFGWIVVFVAAGGVVGLLYWQGGDAVGHSVGFTSQHVADRFNTRQWSFYPLRLPSVVGWDVLIAAAVGFSSLFRFPFGRPKSLPVVWVAVFYLMHSYPKAQDPRYLVLCLPPLFLLATLGIRHGLEWVRNGAGSIQSDPRPTRPRHKADASGGWRRKTAAIMLVGVLGYSSWEVTSVRVPPMPPSYRRAMADLADHLAPFTCLTFVPERANQIPVLFRLEVESRMAQPSELFDFGRMLRAHQVLRAWRAEYADESTVASLLSDWNVKYLLNETPSPLRPKAGDQDIQDLFDWLVARGVFRAWRHYPVDTTAPRHPVRPFSTEFPQRDLVIYERVGPLTYNPNAQPTIRPKRTPRTIPGTSSSVTP